jgi:L-aminopeptidase/D-esterase-like protein
VRFHPAITGALLTIAIGTMTAAWRPAPDRSGLVSITDIPGVRVGHQTLTARPTGCTVVLVDGGAVGGVDVRGGAPGTRETDLLSPQNTVSVVHAIVLSGGSAFGLESATGVMRYLEERGIGFQTSAGPVPIVPAAILFDLGVGGRPDVRPDAACGYAAAARATSTRVEEGSIGAGAGATVGKLAGAERAMKGGIGTAALRTEDGLVVGALMAVNASGTVVDPRTGQPVAGVRGADGRSLEDPFALVRRGLPAAMPGREDTTIGVVVTNARLTKAQARKVAEMAHAGLARTIVPAHTPADGDVVFALATGALDRDVPVGTIGALAAEATSDAILRAVRLATGVPGFPAVRDLQR